MKRVISILMCQAALGLSASAAVPLRWTVETSRAVPAQFEAYQGETLALEACLQSDGKPLAAPSNYSFFWQTNGMGSAYWSVPCTPPNSNTLNSNNSNTLFATWSPTNDVGARVYNCFIGQPGTIYHAAFQLRLRPSPGATPNELPLPQKVIDFAKVTVLNPPWSGGGGGVVDTNAVERISNTAVETNAVTVGLQSSVSSLQSSKADKSTTYTKSETDERLAGKLATSGDGFYFRWSENRSFIDTDAFIYSHDGDFVILEPGGDEWHRLSKKANCPELPVTAGNLAALDENGNLSDSNIGTDDRGIKIEAYGGITSVLLNDGGVYIESSLPGAGEVTVVDNSSYPSVRHDLSAKADRSMISATNETFSNAVATVARTVQPTTIRAYDRVRRCWWVLDMVNGVPTWTVEE